MDFNKAIVKDLLEERFGLKGALGIPPNSTLVLPLAQYQIYCSKVQNQSAYSSFKERGVGLVIALPKEKTESVFFKKNDIVHYRQALGHIIHPDETLDVHLKLFSVEDILLINTNIKLK